MRWLIVLFCSAYLCAAEGLVTDQWFTGQLNGATALSGHETVTQSADGGLVTNFTMTMLFSRSLAGFTSTMSMTQKRHFEEGADGLIHSFHFDDDENGTRTTARGVIKDGVVEADITRNGQTRHMSIPVPEGIILYGNHGGQQLLVESSIAVGESVQFHSIELLMGHIRLITSTGVLKHRSVDGSTVYDVTVDLMPMVTTSMSIDPKGDLIRMSLDMGPIAIRLKRCEKPVPLHGATLDVGALVHNQGRAPVAQGRNLYRLPKRARQYIPENEFQCYNADGLLVVEDQAQQSVPEKLDTYMKAEPQLEIDDPSLRQWVQQQLEVSSAQTQAERAECLRMAVRTHIRKKDLSKGDATALETFQSACGDCTEHANLLCAALRIAGIPARTEVGVVYASSIGGWGGHAWTSYYDTDLKCWALTDAAYPGINRCMYIMTAVSSGNDDFQMNDAILAGTTALMGKSIEVCTGR